ncbi:MAG: hypothetical protein HY875_16885 [Chloroflexi bacterium]|nr:hypothetical protein [Chloroflexota bacterium]
MSDSPGPIRFADILTTGSAVSSYLGASTVTAAHLIEAVAILRGEKLVEELGRPVSPLVSRSSQGAEVEPATRELVQHWFFALGQDINATLDEDETALLLLQLAGLIA